MPKSVHLRSALIACLALLAACATPTPYREAKNEYDTGYTAQQIETNRFRISFRGNSLTTRQTVDTYMLYRAAEVTLRNGCDYFVIVNRNVDKNTAYESYGDTLAWGWDGGWGWGRRGGPGWGGPGWGPGFDYSRPINTYDAIADILLQHGRKPPNDPYAYDARDVLEKLGPHIDRGMPSAVPPGPGQSGAMPAT